MKVIELVMPMAMIHLSRTATRLLRFSPTRLNSFTVGSSSAGEKVETEHISTTLDMPHEVHLWDKQVYDVDD